MVSGGENAGTVYSTPLSRNWDSHSIMCELCIFVTNLVPKYQRIVSCSVKQTTILPSEPHEELVSLLLRCRIKLDVFVAFQIYLVVLIFFFEKLPLTFSHFKNFRLDCL